MEKMEDYREHAAECRRMARRAPLEFRQQLEDMAKAWEELAEVRRREMQKRSKS